MKTTPIQWCDGTVNPVMGCSGCELWDADDPAKKRCYAGILHEGRGRSNSGYSPQFETTKLFPGRMEEASRWSDLAGSERPGKPWLNAARRIIFVSDMGDALSEGPTFGTRLEVAPERAVPFEFLKTEIIDVVMSERGQRHVWMWLTKRPHRMAKFAGWLAAQGIGWPENLWVGTSITTRKTLHRVRELAKVGNEKTTRFLSAEPLFGEVSLANYFAEFTGSWWVIIGGESQQSKLAGAHEFKLEWARKLAAECKNAKVPFFIKQLGRNPTCGGERLRLKNGHGGDWSEWPIDLHVREIPPSAYDNQPDAAACPPHQKEINMETPNTSEPVGQVADGAALTAGTVRRAESPEDETSSPRTALVAPTANADNVEDLLHHHETRIRDAVAAGAAAFIAFGQRLQDAKSSLPHGEWKPFVTERLGFSMSKVQRAMKVAAYSPFQKPHVVELLPSDQQSLACLTMLPEETFETLVKAKGASFQSMARRDINAAVKALQGTTPRKHAPRKEREPNHGPELDIASETNDVYPLQPAMTPSAVLRHCAASVNAANKVIEQQGGELERDALEVLSKEVHQIGPNIRRALEAGNMAHPRDVGGETRVMDEAKSDPNCAPSTLVARPAFPEPLDGQDASHDIRYELDSDVLHSIHRLTGGHAPIGVYDVAVPLSTAQPGDVAFAPYLGRTEFNPAFRAYNTLPGVALAYAATGHLPAPPASKTQKPWIPTTQEIIAARAFFHGDDSGISDNAVDDLDRRIEQRRRAGTDRLRIHMGLEGDVICDAEQQAGLYEEALRLLVNTEDLVTLHVAQPLPDNYIELLLALGSRADVVVHTLGTARFGEYVAPEEWKLVLRQLGENGEISEVSVSVAFGPVVPVWTDLQDQGNPTRARHHQESLERLCCLTDALYFDLCLEDPVERILFDRLSCPQLEPDQGSISQMHVRKRGSYARWRRECLNRLRSIVSGIQGPTRFSYPPA